MKRTFVDFNGNKIKDVAKYVREYMRENPDCELFVGTDSQVHFSHTRYVAVICMYVPGSGAHLIYSSDNKQKKHDLFSRLWDEVVTTIDVAAYLRDETNEDVRTHFDINPDDTFRSHIVYKAAMGYAKGAGFSFKVKPEAWAATCAADMLCK